MQWQHLFRRIAAYLPFAVVQQYGFRTNRNLPFAANQNDRQEADNAVSDANADLPLGVPDADEVRAFLSDHNGWRVGVAAHHCGHDGSIADRKTREPVERKVRADDGTFAGPHAAGARRVPACAGRLTDQVFELAVGGTGLSCGALADRVECGGVQNLRVAATVGNHEAQIFWVRKVIRVDPGRVEWIVGGKGTVRQNCLEPGRVVS